MINLSDIKSESPFRTPDSYFDDFQQDIETRISEEHIRNLCGNVNPFQVPTHYFENLKLTQNTKPKSKIISLLKPLLAVAAVLLFGFGVWKITSENIQKTTISRIETTVNQLNIKSEFVIDAELQNVIIEDYLADVDVNSVAEYFNEDDSIYSPETLQSSDDEIVEYLSDYLAYSEIEDGF